MYHLRVYVKHFIVEKNILKVSESWNIVYTISGVQSESCRLIQNISQYTYIYMQM